ncbi:hypothetical protein K7432_006546 [Basidiobolus ranarum]|uniref:Uncharacterized protein n=1 Tax=Basidiobolus ranarum TaxID=34480 RepID=A0ABR2W1N7_9FUNG
MKFGHSSIYLIASLASATLALPAVELTDITSDPNCITCYGTMPCMTDVLAGKMPDQTQMAQCVCTEKIFAIYESHCLKCSLITQKLDLEDPSNTLEGLKKECASELASSSPSTNNTAAPTESTKNSSSKFVLSSGVVAIAALAVTLLV